MGCDIHFYVERRATKDAPWESADKWTKDPYDDEGDPLHVAYADQYYTDRNYRLFSILANVRNGYGAAGCDTGDGFVPIVMPRGVPDDASAPVKAENERWDCDGHSHSWLTLRDLLDYDWTRTTKLRGWLNGPELFDWVRWRREHGESPEEYSGGVMGASIEHVTAQELERRLAAIDVKDYAERKKAVEKRLSNAYAPFEWEQPYYKCAESFLGRVIPRLLRLGDPENVRCVFWFDN